MLNILDSFNSSAFDSQFLKNFSLFITAFTAAVNFYVGSQYEKLKDRKNNDTYTRIIFLLTGLVLLFNGYEKLVAGKQYIQYALYFAGFLNLFMGIFYHNIKRFKANRAKATS